MSDLNDILSRLRGVKGADGQWSARCPAHNDKTPSLSITVGRGKLLLHCHAGCTYKQIMTALDIGEPVNVTEKPPKPPAPIDWKAISQQCRDDLSPELLDLLSGTLSVRTRSLRRIGVGYYAPYRCYSFPMRDERHRIIGFRLRRHNGEKLCIPGSRNGLFIPVLTTVNPLYICEGPTDTAAALDLHLNAFGRPSCNGGVKFTVEVCQHEWGWLREVVIVADADKPGWDGAATLAKRLARIRSLESVKVIVTQDKDLRAWVRRGATRRDLEAAVHVAENVKTTDSRLTPSGLSSGSTATKNRKGETNPAGTNPAHEQNAKATHAANVGDRAGETVAQRSL